MKEKESNTWRPQDADKELIKQQIRNRVRNTKLEDNAVLIPAKPTPTINDSDSKVVAVYARVSTKSTEQVSSIENQTKYYTEKVEKTPNWTLQEIYSDEGKSGTSMRKRTEFQRMLKDAKDKKMDLILCASVSRFARNVSDCIEQVDELRTQNPSHPVGVYFETENIYTLDEGSQQSLDMHAMDILPILNPKKNRLAIVPCKEEESASVEWARQKDGKWLNKQITSLEFVEKIYSLMNWDRNCRYKILGRIANSSSGLILVFDLDEAIFFAAKATEYIDKDTGKVKKRRTIYYPDEYKDRIGKSFSDYAEARQMSIFENLEGYVGKTYEDAETDEAAQAEQSEVAL